MKKLELQGETFGRWTVLAQVPGATPVTWHCQCVCGKTGKIITTSLRAGTSTSCGCLARELTCKRNSSRAVHGLAGTPTYHTWKAMLSRCENPRDPAYRNYGGRGIRVCRRWQSIDNFVADMGLRPEGKTIERKKNNKGYSRSNCVWATHSEQARNKRNTRLLTWAGETRPLVEWAGVVGLGQDTIWHRLNVGWTVEQALTIRSKHGQRVPR